jgi:hypothetical protein
MMSLSVPLKPWRRTKGAAYRAVEDAQTPDPSSDDRDVVAAFPGWPRSPQPVKKSLLALSGEIALLILPIAFIGLCYQPHQSCLLSLYPTSSLSSDRMELSWETYLRARGDTTACHAAWPYRVSIVFRGTWRSKYEKHSFVESRTWVDSWGRMSLVSLPPYLPDG